LYLAISSRPNILLSVNKTSRKYEDWYNVLKIFKYLKGNSNYGIKFSNTDNFNLNVNVNADIGKDKEIRKSTIQFIMFFNSAPYKLVF